MSDTRKIDVNHVFLVKPLCSPRFRIWTVNNAEMNNIPQTCFTFKTLIFKTISGGCSFLDHMFTKLQRENKQPPANVSKKSLLILSTTSLDFLVRLQPASLGQD